MLTAPTMTDLWDSNHPRHFWRCHPEPPEEVWGEAIANAMPELGLPARTAIESALIATLGEGRFGPAHWDLGMSRRAYYLVKSLIPRPVTRRLRQLYNHSVRTDGIWPIDGRYVRFLWNVLRCVLTHGGIEEVSIRNLWPGHDRFAFVLTHDVETAAGQDFVEAVADFEESLGFRSSFNFVPERYKVNHGLMDALRARGFEVGVHGLHHDGRLFDSESAFMRNAERINRYLKEWNARGFRAELTHRQPQWMQALEIEYDLSFFDTDPFEPIPGGTMSIWPFLIGHFVELPYTLVQDYTLTSVLGQDSPRMWLEKVGFIERYFGMALVNSHPDYLRHERDWDVYCEFLAAMKTRGGGYWHALPSEVADWWRRRIAATSDANLPGLTLTAASLRGDSIEIAL